VLHGAAHLLRHAVLFRCQDRALARYVWYYAQARSPHARVARAARAKLMFARCLFFILHPPIFVAPLRHGAAGDGERKQGLLFEARMAMMAMSPRWRAAPQARGEFSAVYGEAGSDMRARAVEW